MAISRRQANFIVIVAILSVMATFMLLAWMTESSTVAITAMEYLSITDVQFEKDYLNITVENIGSRATTINKVIVNQTSTPYTVTVHEPIGVGDQISIRVSFNWTSGYIYQIKLETTLDNSYFCTEVAP